MSDVNSIAFAVNPNDIPSFLLDWELTKLCNLDCSYCPVGIEGGHDNSTKHPPLEECLHTIDFMYEYVDLYMQARRPNQRKVILNVYGGESLFHPDIVEILEACRSKYEKYKDRWYLTITCTTNAVVGQNLWSRIVPLIDQFSMSYHAENLPKQKQQYCDNLLYLKQHNKKSKSIIMMHNDPDRWTDCENIINFCQEHSIDYLVKAIDVPDNQWSYTPEQFARLKEFWISKTRPLQRIEYKKSIDTLGATGNTISLNEGRACCGGRQLSLNSDLRSSVSFVPAQGFRGWSCSVNWFFLFVQQLTGAVYTNKDCRTSTNGRVEPLGYLSESTQIINQLKTQLDGNMPVIKCVKKICMCGFCAPKAKSPEEFMKLIKRHVPDDIFVANL